MKNFYKNPTSAAAADLVDHDRIMDPGIHPLWQPVPAIAGPAYPVCCEKKDNSMVHGAVYCAPPGSVIVVQTDDVNFAVAGGNVCAVAQKRDIVGMVIDGSIRDAEQIREMGFPVFCRSVYPKPGTKKATGSMEEPVVCGGVMVSKNDLVVADEDGIAVVPCNELDQFVQEIKKRIARETEISFQQWQAEHFALIDKLMLQKRVPVWTHKIHEVLDEKI
jgi:regulator of RNase E activity RraA